MPGRNVSRDLQRHIIDGRRGARTGRPGIIQQIDNALLEHDDPMEFGADSGVFGSQGAEAIQQASRDQSANLSSGMQSFGKRISMSRASSNTQRAESASQYGPRNTGR